MTCILLIHVHSAIPRVHSVIPRVHSVIPRVHSVIPRVHSVEEGAPSCTLQRLVNLMCTFSVRKFFLHVESLS
jgi:hypothetical protein